MNSSNNPTGAPEPLVMDASAIPGTSAFPRGTVDPATTSTEMKGGSTPPTPETSDETVVKISKFKKYDELLKQSNAQKAELERQAKLLHEKEQKFEEELKIANDHATGLNGELKTANDRATSLDGELKTANDRATSLDGQLQIASQCITGLDERLKIANECVTDLGGQLKSAIERVTDLGGELKSAKADVNCLKNEKSVLQAQLKTASEAKSIGAPLVGLAAGLGGLTLCSLLTSSAIALSAAALAAIPVWGWVLLIAASVAVVAVSAAYLGKNLYHNSLFKPAEARINASDDKRIDQRIVDTTPLLGTGLSPI